MPARYLLPAAALLVTACAAAMPGYSPPPLKEKRGNFVARESGSMTDGGRYELSASEMELDCKRLTGSIQITISRIKDAHFRAEPSVLAQGMQQAAAPVFGGSARGADREAEYARDRARLDAYNRQLAAKNCKTVDIDAELARPAEPQNKRY